MYLLFIQPPAKINPITCQNNTTSYKIDEILNPDVLSHEMVITTKHNSLQRSFINENHKADVLQRRVDMNE